MMDRLRRYLVGCYPLVPVVVVGDKLNIPGGGDPPFLVNILKGEEKNPALNI